MWRCGGLAPLPPRGGVRTAHRGVHLWLALRRERGAQQVERVAGNGGGRARQRATAAAAAAAAGGAGHGRGKGVSAAPGAHCPAPHPHTHTRSPEKGDADLCGDAPPRRCCLALLQHHKLDRGVGYGEQLARHGAAPEALRRWRRVGAGGSAWPFLSMTVGVLIPESARRRPILKMLFSARSKPKAIRVGAVRAALLIRAMKFIAGSSLSFWLAGRGVVTSTSTRAPRVARLP